MDSATKKPILILAGPTASGKSALGISIAEKFNGVVINADSMQLYRDLRVLTARPTPEEEARVPHKLYGLLDGAERGTVARWLELARVAIAETIADGRLPILVGGTGLYFKALTEGLADIPPLPMEAEAEAARLLQEKGAAGLHAALGAIDAETADQLRPSDSQRLVRAHAVRLGTGRGLAAWRQEGNAPALSNPACRLLLRPPREILYARIDRRFEGMMNAGALEEARAVAVRADIPENAPMRKAHGLPELIAFLEGRMSREAAITQAKANTRHYAKRQTTWFRHQFIPDLVEDSDLYAKENFNVEAKIFPFIVRYLLTCG